MKTAANPSITRRLLWFIMVPVVALIIACAAVAAATASRSVNALYDQQLKNNAGVLLSFVLYESYEYEYEDDYDDDDEEDDLLEIAEAINREHGLPVNFRLSIGDKTLFVSSGVSDFPQCGEGFSRVDLSAEKQGTDDWHCYRQTQSLAGGELSVIVEMFESETDRQQAIRSLVLATFAPLIVLPLLVAALTYRAVSRTMGALRTVSSEVALRSVDNLERLSIQEQPEELLPVAKSVNQLLDGIERSLQREKQFTDDAAHELRTPITSIKMTEQLLRRDNKDPALDDYLNNLRASVDQSSQLIDQLLGFARLQSARSLSVEPIDIGKLLRTELGILAPQITAKNLAVTLNDEGYRSPVSANESALALLIRNVLSNATKFSDTAATIYIVLDETSLTIEDDGPGISPDARTRVFDRFYRSADAKLKPGSGLGLALAKWVADTHGFTITAVSPRHGSGAAIKLVFRADNVLNN